MRKKKPTVAKKPAVAPPRKKKPTAPAQAEPEIVVEPEIVELEKPAEAEPIVVDVELDADLLAGLIEKTKEEPGAPFAPEILVALADLKRNDRKAFEDLRAGLKRVGCRVASLDESLSEEISGGPSARSLSQADIILRLAQALDLFHGQAIFF